MSFVKCTAFWLIFLGNVWYLSDKKMCIDFGHLSWCPLLVTISVPTVGKLIWPWTPAVFWFRSIWPEFLLTFYFCTVNQMRPHVLHIVPGPCFSKTLLRSGNAIFISSAYHNLPYFRFNSIHFYFSYKVSVYSLVSGIMRLFDMWLPQGWISATQINAFYPEFHQNSLKRLEVDSVWLFYFMWSNFMDPSEGTKECKVAPYARIWRRHFWPFDCLCVFLLPNPQNDPLFSIPI